MRRHPHESDRPSGRGPPLFSRQHRLGLALEVEVEVAADVDGDSLDGAAGENVRVITWVVVRHRFTAVTADAQALAGEREHSRLGPDAAFADFLIPVVQGKDSGGNARWLFSVLG